MDTSEVLKEFENTDYVFKRCAWVYYDCIVILKKPKDNFKSNEDRDLSNKNFAKYRCNGLITVAIYDLIKKKFIDVLSHRVQTADTLLKVTYKVGQLTIPDSYDEDINAICTHGIHYFLNLNCALRYSNGYVREYGTCKYGKYDGNGNFVCA